MTNFDSSNLYVGIENSSARRIERVNKNGAGRNTVITNTTALNQTLRAIYKTSDSGLLVAKSGTAPNGAVEKFNYSGQRLTVGANAFIQTPVGATSLCATSTSMMTALSELSNGYVLFAHAVATTGNRIGMISSEGYAANANCITGVGGPIATALPTSLLMHSSGKLLASYASTTATSNYIYAYDVDSSLGTISNATQAYYNISIAYGISAIAEDTSTRYVYVANAASTFNTIEKFSFNSTTKTLTRIGSSPFIIAGVYNKCISGMVVAD